MKRKTQPVVYRVYDADDRLMYIGSTKNFPSRLATHRSTSWWAPLATRFGIEVHLDEESARRAELEAIHRESPAFNWMHNQRWPDEQLPLTEKDIQTAREFLARGRAGHLPYPMRWIAATQPAIP